MSYLSIGFWVWTSIPPVTVPQVYRIKVAEPKVAEPKVAEPEGCRSKVAEANIYF